MAKISNPRKQFNFQIAFSDLGLDGWLAQKVTIPDIEAEQVEHGDTNHDIKTAGRKKFSNVIIDRIMTTNNQGPAGDSNYFYNWLNQCQDAIAGGGAPPTSYKRTLVVTEFAEDGKTVLNVHTLFGAWPNKIKGLEFDRKGSDNTVEQVELSVDVVEKV